MKKGIVTKKKEAVLLQAFSKELEQIKNALIKQTSELINEHPHFNCQEVAAFLKVSKPTIWNWKKAGKIPFVKIGGKVFFPFESALKIKNEGLYD